MGNYFCGITLVLDCTKTASFTFSYKATSIETNVTWQTLKIIDSKTKYIVFPLDIDNWMNNKLKGLLFLCGLTVFSYTNWEMVLLIYSLILQKANTDRQLNDRS